MLDIRDFLLKFQEELIDDILLIISIE